MKTKRAVEKKSVGKSSQSVPVQTPLVQHRINEVAMLASLNISRWVGASIDASVTAEVAKKHNNRTDMGQYKKFLIEKGAMEPISSLCIAARRDHNRLTLPWMDGGTRILSSAGYSLYTETMRKHKDEYWKKVRQDFLPKYMQLKQEAKALLNSLYDEADYPSPEAIASKFDFRIGIMPIPDFEDWRVNLTDTEVNRLRQQGQNDLQQQLKTSTQDIWRRLQEVIAKMVERLNAYTVSKDGKVQNSFRDSLVTNISDMLELVPILNVVGDPDIDRFSARIKKELTQYDPEALRTDEKVRKDVARRAEEIMAKMSGFLS